MKSLRLILPSSGSDNDALKVGDKFSKVKMGNRVRLVEVQDKLQQDLTFLAAPQPRIQNGPLRDKPPFSNWGKLSI